MMFNGIAFFDLDGTITTKDTYIDFIKYCRGNTYYFFGLLLLLPFIFMYAIKVYPNFKLKETFFKFYFSKFTAIELNELGIQYAQKRLPHLIRSGALDRIQWHKSQNHRVIILTASSPIWLQAWCDFYQVDLIGTSFEIEANHYSGKILGKNCHGEQKKIIVQQILANSNAVQTFGYGDTKADLFFMNLVHEKFYKPFI